MLWQPLWCFPPLPASWRWLSLSLGECVRGVAPGVRGAVLLAFELPSPHRWTPWFSRIAKRVVVDEQRRDEVQRRLYGVRWLPTAEISEGGVAMGGLDGLAAMDGVATDDTGE